MADTPNQSGNNRTPNTLAGLGASVMPSSIARAIEGASPEQTQRYQRLTEQIGRIQENSIYQLGQANPLLLTLPEQAKQYNAMEARLASYRRQQEIMEESAATRANRLVSTNINQSFASGTINGQIASRLQSTAAQQEALRIAARVGPEHLQRNIARSEERMKGYAEEAAGLRTVNRFGERDPDAESRLQQLYGLREIEISRRTGMVGAARIHRMQGLDPESQQDALINLVGKAQGLLDSRSPDIRKLTTLAATDFKKQEQQAAERLTKAFEKLAQVSDVTSDEFKALKKEVNTAEKQFKDIQAARGYGGGGGGGPNGWQVAAAGFGAFGMAVQQIGVNQRLAQMSNVAGYANFQNDIYQTYKAANAGDVASLMLLPQFQAAEDFGGGLKTAANIAVGARGIGGIAQIGAGAVQGLSTLNAASDVLNTSGASMALRAGASDLIGGAATTAEAGFDLARGVSAGQADIAGRQARIAVARALQATGAEQLQGFRDYGVGLGVAAQGMGGAGEGFLRSTATAGMLSRLAAARIGPEQFAQLAQQGVNSMGGGFNQEQIFAARALERRGLGPAQANLDRMAQLYAAGANNPQEGLGRILEAAIPKGFDNSKLVGQLVQFSAQAAQAAGGAATGLNLTAASATLLTSGINPGTQNKEALLQHAADLQGVFKGNETNISTSYAGMTNVARMMRAGGRGGIEGVIAGNIPTEILMSIRDAANPEQRRKGLLAAGLSASTTPSQIEKYIQNKQLTEIEAGGAGFIVANQAKGGLGGLASRIAGVSGNLGKLSAGDTDVLRQIAGLESANNPGQRITPQDIANRISGIATRAGGTGADVFDDKNVGKLQKSMDDLRTQGFVQLSTAAMAAAKSLDPLVKSTGAIEKLASAFKQVEGTIGAVEKAAPTAAARGAAGGKGFDTTQWDEAGKKLNKVLDKILTRLGSSPVPSQRDTMAHQ